MKLVSIVAFTVYIVCNITLLLSFIEVYRYILHYQNTYTNNQFKKNLICRYLSIRFMIQLETYICVENFLRVCIF